MNDFTGQINKDGSASHSATGQIAELLLITWNDVGNSFKKRWALIATFCLMLASFSTFAQAPTIQAKDILVRPVVNSNTSITFSWTNGNGSNRIVVVRTFNAVYTPPDLATAPASNVNFGAGTDLDPGGAGAVAKSVFNSSTDGGGTTVTVLGLSDDTRYFVQIFEYNGTAGTTVYNVLADSQNPLGFQNNTANGTFTRPTGVTSVTVAAWGGGGGGGGADSNGSENRAGGGGSGGSFTLSTNQAIAGNQTITIGTGGGGGDGTDSPQNGGTGGTTSFGALVTAIGGGGGILADGTDRTGAGGGVTTGTTANGGAGGEAPPGGVPTTNATASGAGGASGGPGGAGGNASGSTAGVAASAEGGNGAVGLTGLVSGTGGDGNNAVQLGGGGSGGWDNLSNNNSGNGSAGGNGFRGALIVTWTTPPTPTISIAGADPTNGNPVFRVVFSTPINTGTFIGTDVTITGTTAGTESAAIAEIAPSNGTTFTITVSGMTGSGTVIANIAVGTLTDVAGNANLISNAGTTINYTHDVTGPTVAISVSGPNPTNTSPVFQVLFNEAINISSFVSADVVLTGTAGATTATIAEIAPNNGTTFTITATGMTGPGSVIANIAAGVITDRASTPNVNSVANLNTTITYDNAGPSVTVNQAVAQLDPTNGATINFTAVFNEAINPASFTAADVTLAGTATGSTAGTPTTADNITWNIPVTGMSATGTVIASLAASTVTDPAGNANTASTFTDRTVTYDITPPTVTVNQAVAQTDPTNGATINFTAVFSEAINPASFIATDVTNTGTAPGAVIGAPTTADNITWNIPVTGMSANGTVILAMAASTVTDVAGNNNAVSTFTDRTVTFDNQAPSVTVNQAVAQIDPTNASPINFTAVFSEAINPASFIAVDVTNSGTAPGAIVGLPTTADNITWNIPVTGMSGDGTVVLSIAASAVTDAAGNNNTVSTSTDNTVTFDVPPTVTVNQAVAQLDPTGISPINFTVVFSKAINPASFIATDVTISGTATGSTAGAPTTADNITWNIPVTGMSSTGTVIASLGAGVALDPAGFGNIASTFTDRTVTYDQSPPSVTVNQAGAQPDPTNTTINFTAVFSEAINPATFIATDVTNSGTAPGAVVGAPTTADNITWNIPVTGMSAPGTVILTLAASTVTDLVGLNNTASTFTDNTVDFDNVPPSLTINQAVAQADPTNVATINFTAVFSEPINPATFAAADITNAGTAPGATVGVPTTADNITWNIPVTGLSGSGTVVLSMLANRITDPAGNNNTASTSTDNSVTYDILPPTVTVNQAGGQADPTNASPINFTAVFSEPINPATFLAGDITLAGTAAGSVVGAPTTSDNITWSIPVTGMSSTGTVILSMASSVVTDPSGNNNTASTFTDRTVTYDITPPAVSSIVIGPAAPLTGIGTSNGTSASSLPFQVTFTEPVSGLDPTDLTLSTTGTVIGTIASVTGGPIVYNVTVNAVSGTGTMRLDFFSNGTVRDDALNPTVASFNSGGGPATYSIVLPEPAGHVTGFAAVPGPDNYSVQLSWSSTVPSATAYLIRVRGQLDDDSNGSFATVTDGTTISNDFVFGDGNGEVNISSATLNFTFSTLLSGKTYTFEIIPYALSGNNTVDNIDFRIDGSQPSVTATVTTASTSTITAGSTSAPATISSLSTSYGPDINLSFRLQDDGPPITQGLDNARTRFTQLVISAGGGNTVASWSNVLAEAQLIDITENPGSPVLTGTIGANSITFSGLATGSGAIGALDDNEIKEYTLRVRLRSTLLGGANLTADNQAFDFVVNTASFTYNTALSQPSRFQGAQVVTSGFPGRNEIDVAATAITFNPAFGGTQPPATASVLTNLSISPVARAVDANGNTDHNYTLPLAITNAGSLPMSIASLPSDNVSPNGGVYTFPAGFQYTDDGTGTANNGNLTLTNGGVTGSSGNVTVTYSSTTTIVAGAFGEPAAYSSLFNDLIGFDVNNNRVFDFNVLDDNGAGGDGAPTRISQVVITQGPGNDIADWTQAITDVLIYDGSTTFPGTVTATTITFSALPNTPGAFGYIADNGTRNFRVYIRLRSSLGGTLPSTIDNLNLSYEVLTAGITLDPLSSAIAPGENENSGSTNNAVDVLATELRFTNIIGSPTLVSKDISLQQAVPVVQATDNRGNRDLNYSSTTIGVTDNGGRTLLNAPAANSLTSGLLTFANNFQITTVGGPSTLTISTATLNAVGGTPSSAISPAFLVQAGLASTITAGAASPATISSLVNASTGVPVFNFIVNDDPVGTPPLQNDGNSTLISQVTITQRAVTNTITNWSQAIAGAILTDGTTSIVASSITATSLVFSGIPTGTLGNVADNATKTYTLRIWLNTSLGGTLPTTIDGLAFGFEVLAANIVTSVAGTGIIPGENHNSGAANVVTVLASELRYIFPAAPTSASLNTDFPGITIQSTDANGNRDLDFEGAGGTVRLFANATAASTANGPVVGTTQFTDGLLTFAANFQYTSGINGDIVTLDVRAGAGPGTVCGVNVICASAPPVITLLSSFESSIVGDPTFTYSATIPYVNHQEPTNIQNTISSLEIGRMLLVDGSRTNFPIGAFLLTTGTNNDGLPNTDQDGAATNLTSLTIRVTNPSNLRRIALYSGGVEIGTEINVAGIGAITDATPFFDFVFSGAPLLQAIDNGLAPISVRASFRNTAPEVVDGEAINISVVAASLSSGSRFFPTPPPGLYIAGVLNGYQSTAGANLINVLATKLDFVSQPAIFAGIKSPVATGVVEAHDQFGILDIDFDNQVATLAAAVAVNGSFSFFGGILDMSSMTYDGAGDGTLTVSAGGLTSIVNNTVGGLPNVAVQCIHVDVLHVTTSYTNGGVGGVVTSTNLIGGTFNRVIFGFTFDAAYSINTPSNQPLVNRFTLSFSNATLGVFNNMRVVESTSPLYAAGLPDVTTLGATTSQPLPNTLQVDFTSSPRDLRANPTLSYFLIVDVDINASGNASSMQVSVEDDNIVGSSTNNNIVVANGSSKSNTSGQAYTFAAIFPPTLTGSYPSLAQTNVDPNQLTLALQFSVPVWSLDGKIRLTDKLSGVFSDLTLASVNGTCCSTVDLARPIIFNIPVGFLQPDREYFVTIAQGINTVTTQTGIMDESNNLFPGISYSGTLYFRTFNSTPPKLLGVPTTPSVANNPLVTDITTSGAVLNATFDKPGKAYFMVTTEPPATVPSNSQINGLVAYPNVVSRGTIAINSINPISQFGIITPAGGTFVAGTHYVWIYSETYSELDSVQTAYPTASPYGSAASSFAVGGVGPTLTFAAPGAGVGPVTLNLPSIAICNNSPQILNSPIIISEGANGQFNTGGAQQTFSLVLPAGFQFDVSTTNDPGNPPRYGSLQLVGTDFIAGSSSFRYLGNSILQIRYGNLTGNGGVPGGSRDRIIITGLRVLATGTSNDVIFRLGGTALTAAIPDATPMGTLRSFDSPPITFNNSYSTNALGISQPGAVVTAIPDNTIPSSIILTPYVDPTVNDYGPSSFSGQGVSINVLTLAAVTPDVPFNITITHTDNNGCVSNNPVQYLVYDHNSAVNITGPGGQGPYCVTNTNFVINGSVPPNYGILRFVPFDNLNSHRMETLTAAIPAGATPATQVINPIDFGGAWVPIIASLPNLISTTTIGGLPYRSYDFDLAKILDAPTLSGGVIPEPYNVFRDTTSVQRNTYYTGGSLGFIEFTGTYRNSSNTTVQVPRKQLVEVFLPAVPIVEVGQSNQPVPGTPVYCEAGGLIVINGYPAAVPGTSKGRFTLTDAVSSMVIYDVPPVGASTIPPIIPPNLPGSAFVDFGNGSAQLDPAQLTNLYRTMRITYTFQPDNSPCPSTGSIVIQVTPNPVTNFAITSPITLNTPFATSYCVGRQVNFNAASTTIAGGGVFSIVNYGWYFGQTGIGAIEANGITNSTIYTSASTYNVELEAVSDRGCLSVPFPAVTGSLVVGRKIIPVAVGGIPDVKYKMEGVSIEDVFRFNSNSDSRLIAAPPGPQLGDAAGLNTTVSTNDNIAEYQWDFGDGSPVATVNTPTTNAQFNQHVVGHAYATTGRKDINLTVTSQIGCRNSLLLQSSYRSIIVLDTVSTAVYDEDFETNNGDWQVWGTGTSVAEISANAASTSWEWGAPTTSVAEPDEPLITKTRIWKTNLTSGLGYYNPGEKSALYSPSFDLTNLTRPMISFNAAIQMESSDGVVLQYSLDSLNIADPNKVWLTLGVIGGGQDWFTDQGIAGRPGQQTSNDFGWSRSDITAWQAPKHVLDTLFPPKSTTNPRKAVFRFALGSAAPSVDLQGFALDNVRVGDRTRTILLESFASTSNTNAVEENENNFVKTFVGGVGTEVVKLNYHMNFPGKDPFNEDNPADPSSRALFYNVVTTPRSVLDGEKDTQDRVISQWGQNLYNLRTLQLAQADIEITPTSNVDGSLSILTEIKSKVLTGLNPGTLVHVVVLEKSIPKALMPTAKQGMIANSETSFEFVVKKMLPSASGTPLGQLLLEDDSVTLGPFIWTPESGKLYPNVDDLAVAVFLQDPTPPYEVYQVELVEGIFDPPVVTGLEPQFAEKVIVYPNPANREMTIQLPGPLGRSAGMQMVDQTGRVSLQSSIPEGASSKTFNVSDLASGVYILQIEMGNGVLTRKKVMIIHQE